MASVGCVAGSGCVEVGRRTARGYRNPTNYQLRMLLIAEAQMPPPTHNSEKPMNSKKPHALPGARGPNSWNKIPPEGDIFANTPNTCPFSSRSPHTKTESARSQQHSPAHLCRRCAFLQGSSRHDAVPNRMAVIEYLASAMPSDSYEGIAITYSDIVEDGTTETKE